MEIENMVFASDPVKTLYLETFAEKFDSQNKFYINMIIWSHSAGKYILISSRLSGVMSQKRPRSLD